MICGNVVGGIVGCCKSFILEDENGNQVPGIVVDEVVLLTATAEDIKEGKIACTDAGVVVGTHACE